MEGTLVSRNFRRSVLPQARISDPSCRAGRGVGGPLRRDLTEPFSAALLRENANLARPSTIPGEPRVTRGRRKKPSEVRAIGRPHDLVRADIVGQHGKAVVDRLELNPAVALEEFARPRL